MGLRKPMEDGLLELSDPDLIAELRAYIRDDLRPRRGRAPDDPPLRPAHRVRHRLADAELLAGSDGEQTASLLRSECLNGGTTSMKKFALSAVIAFAATSALAQTTVHEEYYVVRDPATKRCTVVDQKPTVTTTIVDHGIFGTRTEAETGMKTMKICTTEEHEPDHDD
jgi:hypothetical protein